MKLADAIVRRRDARGWLASAFLFATAMTVLSYGSASTVQTNLAALTFAIIAALAIARPIAARSLARVQAIAVLLLAALLACAALQAFPWPEFANPAWNSVSDNLGPVAGTISVAPGMTLDALTALALPFLAFIAALSLFQGDDEALLLWRALAYFGAGYAVFGILQDVLFPEQILFETKKFYIGSLTASFINRNTAGTFFGIAFLLNFGLAFFYLRKVHLRSLMRRTTSFEVGWRDKHGLVIMHGLLAALCAVALFLTQSRGAVGASFVAVIFAVVLTLTHRLTADEASDEPEPWRRYVSVAGALIATVGLFALFGGRSAYRMAEQGGDDARWCALGRRSPRYATIGSWEPASAHFRTCFPSIAIPIAPGYSASGSGPTISSSKAISGSVCLSPSRQRSATSSSSAPLSAALHSPSIPIRAGHRSLRAGVGEPALDCRFFAAHSWRRGLFCRRHGGGDDNVAGAQRGMKAIARAAGAWPDALDVDRPVQ